VATTGFGGAGTARGQHASFAYNGYLYVTGGWNGNSGGTMSDALYAPINSNGTVGTWTTTSGFSAVGAGARSSMGSVINGGFVYLLGGMNNSSAMLGEVLYAAINSNGTLGSWSVTSNFLSAGSGRYNLTSVVYNGYIYVIGGELYNTGNISVFSDILYAPINSNGTLGAWKANTSFAGVGSGARFAHSSVTYGGYVYIIGGYSGSANLSDVLYARINNGGPGTVGAWTTSGNSLNTARFTHGSVAYNGYIYAVGGSDGSGNPLSSVEYAAIGSNGAPGAWTTGANSLITARRYLSVAVYNGYLYAIAGYGSSGWLSSVEYAAIGSNGVPGTWTTSANILNTARDYQSSVAYNGYIYAIGGLNGSSAPLASVEYSALGSNGVPGTWTLISTGSGTLNVARYTQTSVVYNGYVYAIAGYSGSSYLSSVEYAVLNSNGSLGSWSMTSALGKGRLAPSSVAYDGYIYVIDGGNPTGLTSVEYTSVNSNGSLGSWSTTSITSAARTYSSAVVYNGYVYIIGGNGVGASVEYAPLNVQPRVASYSKLVDLGSSSILSSLVYNGTLLGGGAVNVSWALAASGTFGATTTVNNVAPGAAVALSGTGRYVWVRFTVDDSVAGSFADSAAGQSFITDITLNYTSSVVYGDPTKRLRGGAYFDPSTGVLQRLNP